MAVLLVDDDPEFRALATGVLRGWGIEDVVEAATFAEALAQADRRAPETVLIDVRLPDGNGYALATELAARDRPPRMILISSDCDAGDDAQARRVGALGFVAKYELVDGRLRKLVSAR